MNDSAAASSSSVDRPGRTILRMSASVSATIRPARAITSISRGDLMVIMSPAKGLPNTIGDLLDRSHGGNAADRPPRLVPGEERRRLLPVRPKPGGHGRRVVVRALLDGPAAIKPRQDLFVGHVE